MPHRLALSSTSALLSPFPYCLGVFRVVAIRVEPKAMTEARFAAELILGRALNEVDKPMVGVVQFSEHLGERKAFLPLRHLSVKGTDAAVCH